MCRIVLLFATVLTVYAVPTPNLPSLPAIISDNNLITKKLPGRKTTVSLRFSDDNKTYYSENIRFLPQGESSGYEEPTRDTDMSVLKDHIEQMISRGVLRLALRLEDILALGQENTLFSPLSIAAALSLVRVGARGNTSQELAEVLGLGTATIPEVVHTSYGHLVSHFDNVEGVTSPETTVASAIFLQQGYPVKESFLNLGRTVYRSEVLSVDFARQNVDATQAINRWVELKTSGHLKNFLSSPVSSTTRVLIANALYFNGEWKHPFPLQTTLTKPFYIQHDDYAKNVEVMQVKMMTNVAELPYVQDARLNCRMVGLPYKGEQVTMYLLQSADPSIRALRELEEALSVEVIENLISSMQEFPTIVSVPRMRLEATISLRDSLEALGVHDLFDPLRADLGGISSLLPALASLVSTQNSTYDLVSDDLETHIDGNTTLNTVNYNVTTTFDNPNMIPENMTGNATAKRFVREINDNPGLYVDEVIHKVEMEVTETGTVAAAATVVSITRDGSRRIVRFDRPFIVFVRHEPTGFIMFYGSVIKPSEVPAV